MFPSRERINHKERELDLPGFGRFKGRGHVAVTEGYVVSKGEVVKEWHDVHGEEAEELIKTLRRQGHPFKSARSFEVAEVFAVEDPSVYRWAEGRFSRRSHWHPERPLPQER